MSPDQFKLYDLIWKRTVASQMTEARGHRITMTLRGRRGPLPGQRPTIEFAGYLRAYVEGSDDPEAELADRETLLPPVAVGEPLECRRLSPRATPRSRPTATAKPP